MYTDPKYIDNSDADLSGFVVNNSAEFLFRNRSEIEETFEIFDSS
jgi:hypothetical protein